MTCPFCPAEGSRMEIHAHLGEGHPERVILGHRNGPNDPYFEVGCPWCEQQAVQSVNPGGRDPAFLEEFQREIRLVAFDLLLYHLQAEHPERIGLAPSTAPEVGGGEANRT